MLVKEIMKKLILLVLVLIVSSLFYIREPFFNQAPKSEIVKNIKELYYRKLNRYPSKQEYDQHITALEQNKYTVHQLEQWI
jgi:uncharacterized membrane protein